jgi:hypothetical protein
MGRRSKIFASFFPPPVLKRNPLDVLAFIAYSIVGDIAEAANLIALEEEDPKLARGHFGRAYELCLRALEAVESPQPLPYALDGNRPFYEAAKGLVHCLLDMGRPKVAKDVCKRIASLDPSDPLAIQRLAEHRE